MGEKKILLRGVYGAIGGGSYNIGEVLWSGFRRVFASGEIGLTAER